MNETTITLNSIILEFDLAKRQSHEIPWEKIDLDPLNKNKIYWIHCNLKEKDKFLKLAEDLHLPDELKNLWQEEKAIWKIIDFENGLAIQISDLVAASTPNFKPSFGNLTIYLNEHFCLTASDETSAAALKFLEESPKNIRYAETPGFIFFLILDNVINNYAEIFQDYEIISDRLDSTIREKHKGTYKEVAQIKNQVVKIKRNVVVLRDILMRISSRKIAVISEHGQQSLSVLFSRSQIVANEADSIRDILNSILDFIDNSLMQKINKSLGIIKTFAAIFLPLFALTGFYNLNQRWISQLSWKSAAVFPLIVILIAISAFFMARRSKKVTEE